jgi:hypothetical protein
MAKLIGLFAIVAVAIGAGIAFWRTKSKSWSSMWDEAGTSTSQWSRTAAQEAQKAADRVTSAFDDDTKKTSDLASAFDDGSKKASDLADEVKGAIPGSQ